MTINYIPDMKYQIQYYTDGTEDRYAKAMRPDGNVETVAVGSSWSAARERLIEKLKRLKETPPPPEEIEV